MFIRMISVLILGHSNLFNKKLSHAHGLHVMRIIAYCALFSLYLFFCSAAISVGYLLLITTGTV